MKNKKKCYVIILIFTFLISNIFSLNKEIRLKLKNRLNFSEEQIIKIENIIIDVDNKKLPIEPIEKFLKESITKNVSYDKFLAVLKKIIDSLELAKYYVENTKTEKFFPKDTVYTTTLLAELIRFGLTEEEFKTIISLLSTQNNTYDDSLIKINYYFILKKYFNNDETFVKDIGVSNPAEIIFFRYINRPVKDFSLIIQSFIKYFNTNLDKKHIYNFLYNNNDLPTKKIVEKIENFIKEDFKSELRE